MIQYVRFGPKAVLLAVALSVCTMAHAQPAFRGSASGATTGTPAFRAATSGAVSGAITFRAGTSAAGGATTIVINKPAGTAQGDVMIAAIGIVNHTVSLTAPAGWTLVRRIDNPNAVNSLAIYRKTAGASEPASYTWTKGGDAWVAGGIQSFSGVDTANPINVEGGQNTPIGFTHATPSITTTVPNAMLVTSHSFGRGGATWTPPAGMNESYEGSVGALGKNGVSIEGNRTIKAAPGATGAKSATAFLEEGGSGGGNAHILALRPAVASNLVLGKPAGTMPNDAMIASIGVQPHTVSITPPAGWTLVRRVDNSNANSNSLAVYHKTAADSEPTSYDWNIGGAIYAVGGIQTFTGVNTGNPIDIENGQTTVSALTHATPSVTTSVANALVVATHTFATSTTWTPPGGMTEGFDIASGTPAGAGQSLETSWVLQSGAGATGTKTATAAGAGNQDVGNTHILALRPTDPGLTIATPSGTAPNDVMIASIGVRPNTSVLTPPAGWTLVRRIDNTSGVANSLAVYRKMAASGEPASHVWGVTGHTSAAGGIQSFSGVDTANPIDVENGQNTPLGLTHATPSVTTTVANAMIVTSHTLPTHATWTPPASMTEGFDVASFGPQGSVAGQGVEGNWAVQASAGATGAKTATASIGEDPGNTHILALRPAPAGPAQLYFIHTDHLNTPRLLTSGAGQAVWRWDQTDPFGGNPPQENPSGLGTFVYNPRLPGQYFDKETNLHYNYFRDYDPGIGRYIQGDPLGLEGGLTLYSYVDNNPLGGVDPEGLRGGRMGPKAIQPPVPSRSVPPVNPFRNSSRDQTKSEMWHLLGDLIDPPVFDAPTDDVPNHLKTWRIMQERHQRPYLACFEVCDRAGPGVCEPALTPSTTAPSTIAPVRPGCRIECTSRPTIGPIPERLRSVSY